VSVSGETEVSAIRSWESGESYTIMDGERSLRLGIESQGKRTSAGGRTRRAQLLQDSIALGVFEVTTVERTIRTYAQYAGEAQTIYKSKAQGQMQIDLGIPLPVVAMALRLTLRGAGGVTSVSRKPLGSGT